MNANKPVIVSAHEEIKEPFMFKNGVRADVVFHPSGQEAPRHSHEESHLIFVRTGQMRFDLKGEIKEVGPGDLVIVPPGVPHTFKVLGEEPCRTICVSI